MALSKDRKTDRMGTPDSADPLLLAIPVAATTTIYKGGLVGVNASGLAVPASASSVLKIVGVAHEKADNSTGSASDIKVLVDRGCFYFANGGGVDAIAQANLGELAYASDDLTVNLTDGAGLRPPVGVIMDVRADGQIGVFVGQPSLWDVPEPDLSQLNARFKARGVVIANIADLTAFTVASNDGITYAAGDIVILALQTTAAQNGPYVVGTVATGTAPLTRPSWWATGMVITPGTILQVGTEGTLWAGSQWKTFAAKGAIVGTDDPNLYPQVVKATVTLSSGAYALGATEGLYLRSTTKSQITALRNTVGGTVTSTIMYACAAADRTAGKSGTGAATVKAVVAAGTVNTADTSTLDVVVTNW